MAHVQQRSGLRSTRLDFGVVRASPSRLRASHRPESPPTEWTATRRALLAGFSSVLVGVPASWALLPDDDDADLVSRAKARRKQRLQEELARERKFARDEGFRKADTKKLEQSVQTAVYQLAVSGDKLETGSLTEVSDLLKADWVSEFDSAASELSVGISGAGDNAKQIVSGLGTLQATAADGDLSGSKKQFVAVVSNLRDWTSLVGLQGLRGL